jgi:hypothetical protein
MTGVTILDRDPKTRVLSFDLRDILAVLGADAERSTWTLRDVESYGAEAAVALHQASDDREVLAGGRLLELAGDVTQIVDGEFSGRFPNEDAAWIIIRAVDSSAFDVETDREDVLKRLKSRFDRVEDLAADQPR